MSAIGKNVALVLRTGNIDKLTKTAYLHIINYHGFIAHYDIYGFRDCYREHMDEFARSLVNGEYAYHDNWDYARRRVTYDPGYYGTPTYQAKVYQDMVSVLNAADAYLREVA